MEEGKGAEERVGPLRGVSFQRIETKLKWRGKGTHRRRTGIDHLSPSLSACVFPVVGEEACASVKARERWAFFCGLAHASSTLVLAGSRTVSLGPSTHRSTRLILDFTLHFTPLLTYREEQGEGEVVRRGFGRKNRRGEGGRTYFSSFSLPPSPSFPSFSPPPSSFPSPFALASSLRLLSRACSLLGFYTRGTGRVATSPNLVRRYFLRTAWRRPASSVRQASSSWRQGRRAASE